MITPVDERLRREAREHAFRYTCDACAHFDGDHQACAHGYPTEPHRVRLELVQEVVFCKDWELV